MSFHRRQPPAPPPMHPPDEIVIDPTHREDLQWFYGHDDPYLVDEERAVAIRRTLDPGFGWGFNERDWIPITSARKAGKNVHGSDPLARYFNPGPFAGVHRLTAVALQVDGVSEAFASYRTRNPPPTTGAAFHEYTERSRQGLVVRDWMLALEKSVHDGSASERDRVLYFGFLHKAAELVRNRYERFASGARDEYDD